MTAALQQRNPLTNIGNINHVPSKTANMKKCPSDSSNNAVPPMNQYQVTFRPSVPHGNIIGVYGSEKSSYPVKSPQASDTSRTAHSRTNPNQYYGTTQGYSYSTHPYYMGWNNYGYAAYPQQYCLPAQPPAIPPKKKPIQPCEPPRDFLMGLRGDNIKSAFHECMDVCNKEKSIKPFEDLLEYGVKLNRGWLKMVFFEEDIPDNRMLRYYAMSIILTFDAQVRVSMRGKLTHAWGTSLDKLRRWRSLMKESTSFLPAIAKHQIDFRGNKTNPFLMYNYALEIEKVQELVAKLGTKANELEDKMHMERVLHVNKERILMQQKYMDALRGTERALEEENKKLSNTLKHWKSCYSKLQQENEDLKKCINLPNQMEV